jgi:hypothetical protein
MAPFQAFQSLLTCATVVPCAEAFLNAASGDTQIEAVHGDEMAASQTMPAVAVNRLIAQKYDSWVGVAFGEGAGDRSPAFIQGRFRGVAF